MILAVFLQVMWITIFALVLRAGCSLHRVHLIERCRTATFLVSRPGTVQGQIPSPL